MNNYQLSVKSYPVYKDSGVEWLGNVPEHWEVRRVKEVGAIKYGLSQPPKYLEEGLPLIRATNIERGKLVDKGLVFISPDDVPYERNPVLRENDILVVRSGAYTADSAIVPKKYDGAIAGFDMVLRPCKIHAKYLSYTLLSNYVLKDQLILSSFRAAQPHLNKEELGTALIVIPPLAEQKSIAHYLDTKTAQCDRKIDLLTQKATQYGKLKQSLINETVTCGLDKSVQMKDSGIEWIGDVPEHWEVIRNKQIFQERSILSSTGKETLLTVSHITGVTPRSEKNVNMFMAETMEGYKICHQGDLIINTMWAWMGALGTSKYFGICSPAYNVYMPVNNVPYDYRYFDYLYRTPNAIVEMTRNSKGIVSSRLRLYAKEFFQIETPLPPVSEQKAIADYLDTKTAQIDKIIQTINTQIEKLKELRKTLINDVVTGKIRV